MNTFYIVLMCLSTFVSGWLLSKIHEIQKHRAFLDDLRKMENYNVTYFLDVYHSRFY